MSLGEVRPPPPPPTHQPETPAMSAQLDKIAPALAKAQAEFEDVKKSGENPHDHYSYATLGDFIEASREVLKKHGLSIIGSVTDVVTGQQRTSRNDVAMFPRIVTMRFLILHASGQWITVGSAGEGIDRADKGIYKAITGARKYGYAAALGLATTDDPEKPRREDVSRSRSSAVADDIRSRGRETKDDGRERPDWMEKPVGFGKFRERTWQDMTEGAPDGERRSWLEWACGRVDGQKGLDTESGPGRNRAETCLAFYEAADEERNEEIDAQERSDDDGDPGYQGEGQPF